MTWKGVVPWPSSETLGPVLCDLHSNSPQGLSCCWFIQPDRTPRTGQQAQSRTKNTTTQQNQLWRLSEIHIPGTNSPRFWFSRSGVGPRRLYFKQSVGNANAQPDVGPCGRKKTLFSLILSRSMGFLHPSYLHEDEESGERRLRGKESKAEWRAFESPKAQGSKVNCSRSSLKSFNLSELQFPLLWNGGKAIYPLGAVGGINAYAVSMTQTGCHTSIYLIRSSLREGKEGYRAVLHMRIFARDTANLNNWLGRKGEEKAKQTATTKTCSRGAMGSG